MSNLALLHSLIGMVLILAGVMLSTAFLILVERRFLALLQDRLGPNRAGPMGIMQPFVDAVKLLTKEEFNPPFSHKWVFIFAPVILPFSVLLSFGFIPYTSQLLLLDSNLALLLILGLSSLSVFSIILGGWASNSKYPLLGAIRGAAQMISYELPMVLSLVAIVLLVGSFRLGDIVAAQDIPFIILQPVGFIIFLICGFAEVNRLPFDLPEAENELASGYNTEYGGIKFALYYLGEYMGIILIAALTCIIFLGGWRGPILPEMLWFLIKTLIVVLFFFWVRTSLPRFRFDQLMILGWKYLLPLSLINLILTGLIGLLWMP